MKKIVTLLPSIVLLAAGVALHLVAFRVKPSPPAPSRVTTPAAESGIVASQASPTPSLPSLTHDALTPIATLPAPIAPVTTPAPKGNFIAALQISPAGPNRTSEIYETILRRIESTRRAQK